MTSKPTRVTGSPVQRTSFSETDPFRDFFEQPLWLSRFFDRPLGAAARAGVTGFAPALDVKETKDNYQVTVELPGAKKDDISVECHDNVLTIKGEKRSEHEEKDEHRHYTERSYGSFSRTLTLPGDASNDVRASFRDGVLTLTIPKAEERKPRVVRIDS